MKKRKIFSFIIILCVLLIFVSATKILKGSDYQSKELSLTREEKDYIKSIRNTKISFAYNSELRYEVHKPVIDILTDELGLEVETKKVEDWDVLFRDTCEGKYDLLAEVTYTEEREKKLYFSNAVSKEYRVGITRSDNAVIEASEIVNKRVGFLEETPYFEFSKLMLEDNKEIFFYKNTEEALKALENRDIDIYISGDSVKAYIVDRKDLQVEFVFQDRPEDVSIVTAKGDMRMLIDIVDKYLESDKYSMLSSTENMEKMLTKKMSEYLENKYPIDFIKDDEIKVLAAKKSFPFSYQYADEHLGSDIELLELFKKLTGIDYKTKLFGVSEKNQLLEKLNENKYNLLIGNSVVESGTFDKVQVSSGLKINSNIISVVRTRSDIDFSKDEDIKIGVISDVDDYVKQSLIYKDYTIYSESDHALDDLKTGKLDVVVMKKSLLDYEKNINNDLSVMQNTFINIPYQHSLLLNKENTLLNNLINETIRFYLIINPVSNNQEWVNKISEYQSKYYKLSYQHNLRKNILIFFMFLSAILIAIIIIFRYNSKNASIIKESKTDSLTGLYSVNSYKHECQNLISKNRDSYGFFMFIDLDNFKKINDTYGHIFGDECLKAFAAELKQFENENSIAFRIAGDEFGFFSIGFESVEEIENHLRAVDFQKNVEIHLPNNQGNMGIGYSVGYSIYNQDTDDFEKLREYADFAMYKSKALKNTKTRDRFLGRFDIIGYREEKEKERKYLEIEKIIENKQLYSEYQEIVDIKNEDLYGYESLSRVSSKQNLSIRELIDASYKMKLTEKLDRVMVVNTMRNFNSSSRVFVNIEATSEDVVIRQIYNIINMAALNKISSDNIVIEIRERDKLSIECMDKIIRLKEMFEFSIAIDNFGTGYSNFTMLFYLKPDILKLDMELIRYIHKDSFKASYIQSIVYFLRKENIKILCEGVETREEYMKLKEIGVDLVQGFYFGHPHRL